VLVPRERWGKQTVPKYEGSRTATGWMQEPTKEEIQASGTPRRTCAPPLGVEERGVEKVKPPKGKSIERQTCAPDVIDALRDAQPSLRDQIAMQLLGRLGLRKNELRLLQVGDFDVARGTVRVHDKGGKIAVVPLGFKTLKRDLQVHLVGRGGGEYLIYPKQDTRCGR
jgi:integrase